MAKSNKFESELAYARNLASSLKRQTSVRHSFFFRATQSDPLPPAVLLLQNRSGNGLHLKMALLYLWAAGSENTDPGSGTPHTVKRLHYPDVAHLFGFENPDNQGKRRVANAKNRLVDIGLISSEARPGKSPIITLLKEDGSGDLYSPPGSKGAGGKYLTLPRGFWSKGWYLHLSGSALISMLALMYMQKSSSNKTVWINPTMRQRNFGFSEDAWYGGTKELAQLGLITQSTRAVRQPFQDDPQQRRHTYEFHFDVLRTQEPPLLSDKAS